MPRGRGGRGGMGKRKPKTTSGVKRELWYKEEGQEYAQVQSMLGNGKLRAYCFDGKVRLGSIRGKMRRRVYIFMNDIILVGLRDFQDEKCDVIWKYYPEEGKTLKAMGEIPESTVIDEKNKQDDSNMLQVKFDAVDSDEENDEDDDMPVHLKKKEKKPKEALDLPSSSSSGEEYSDEEEMTEKKGDNKGDKKGEKGQQNTTSNYKPYKVPSDVEEESESEEEKVDELADI